ncbi:MAG: PAS domain S-box protein [Pseudomonadales bacterium]|nr:PAS domain S-box protein [Pseudomonadales bacterium]
MQLPALDRLPVPVFRCDDEGRLIWANVAWTEQLGVPPGEFWYLPFREFDAAQRAQLRSRCIEANEPFTIRLRAEPPGKPQRWYELVAQPAIPDGANQPQLLGSLIDVTQYTLGKAETEAILETAVDAILTIDAEGRIETFNQAACDLFGYSFEEVRGRNIAMLMGSPHAADHDSYLANYLITGEKKIIGIGRELEARTASGAMIPIYLAVSEIELAGRRRFTGIIRDLTEQHAAREALVEQREKLAHVGRLSTMGEMTASIAHEINQPLTAIAMYAQAGVKMLQQNRDTTKIMDALEKLNVQALRAGAVIERIQRFARAQDSVRELADTNELIRDLLKLAGSDARLHSIELKLELADDLPALFVDPIQIQQVVLNLIRNAIDAMLEIDCSNGRTIVVRSELNSQGEIEVSVSDLGPGVADNQVDLLFTPFHTTKKEGMGMGLSICRTIISEHGGELSYRNKPDAGATFFFRLPQHDA